MEDGIDNFCEKCCKDHMLCKCQDIGLSGSNDGLESVADEKRRADQLSKNCKWLIEHIDLIHAKLCPEQKGTWQDRVKQAVEAAKAL